MQARSQQSDRMVRSASSGRKRNLRKLGTASHARQIAAIFGNGQHRNGSAGEIVSRNRSRQPQRIIDTMPPPMTGIGQA